MSAIAVIVGSSFAASKPAGLSLEPISIETPWGCAVLCRASNMDREAYVLFRHGLPHRWLPNQVPYRAHAAALQHIGCRALLVTSSVGVLDAALPLYQPLALADMITLDNRLPDGSACTMFDEPTPSQGHLVFDEGVFSDALGAQIEGMAARVGVPIAARVTFGYVGGPRSKTSAENRMWQRLGAQVNSMSVGPEVVLANELEIPVAAVVVGHKYSLSSDATLPPGDQETIERSLDRSRDALQRIVVEFLRSAQGVPFANSIHRFGAG